MCLCVQIYIYNIRYKYIYLHIKFYCFFNTMYFDAACPLTTLVMIWSQKRIWNERHNNPLSDNEYTDGYRLILISLSVPLCDVLSDCLYFVWYRIIMHVCMKTLAFIVQKGYYCSLEKGKVGNNWAIFMAMIFVPCAFLFLWCFFIIQYSNGTSQFFFREIISLRIMKKKNRKFLSRT